MDFPSRLDLYALARQYITTRATKIDPAQVDVEGSEANIFAGVSSMVGYQVVLALIQDLNALLLSGAFDEDLDRYGIDRYQLARKGAAAALGTVRIFRASTAGGAGVVPSNTVVVTLNGVQYFTLADASFGAGDFEVETDVRAAQAGKVSQVGANQIRQFAQPGLLFDSTLQVINDAATAGGEDAEEDDAYRERIRDFWRSARRGTKSAIEFGARTVNGIESALAEEVINDEGEPARAVNLYIADSSGVASAALGATVRATLDDYRAAGIAVITSNSIPQIVDVTLQLQFNAGVDTSSLTQLIRANVVEYVNSLGVSETLLRAGLFSVLQRFASDGLIVAQTSVVAPTGDLVPDVGQTLRTRLQNVTVV